jgi:hypothetical protein
LQELVRVGDAHRAIGATGMNEASSRSHSILTIQLLARDTLTGSARTSRLCLVDLAGSEAVSRTGAEGSTLNEAKMINKSLFTLSLCSLRGAPARHFRAPLLTPLRASAPQTKQQVFQRWRRRRSGRIERGSLAAGTQSPSSTGALPRRIRRRFRWLLDPRRRCVRRAALLRSTFRIETRN